MRELTLLEKLIENLAGNVPRWSLAYMPREKAHQQLKALLGRDLGLDAQAWRAWIENPVPTERYEQSLVTDSMPSIKGERDEDRDENGREDSGGSDENDDGVP